MSDYFSVSHTNNNEQPNYTGQAKVDTASILSSGSQYQYPQVVTPGENVSSNATSLSYSAFNSPISTIPNSLNASSVNLLGKNDERSPLYVDVPIPKALPKQEQQDLQNRDGSAATKGDIELEENQQYVREYPTDIMADRFHKWKKILKALIAYLREVAYAQEQFGRINNQLKTAVKFSFLTDIQEGSNKLVEPMTTIAPIKRQQPMTLAEKQKQAELEKLRATELEFELENSKSQSQFPPQAPLQSQQSQPLNQMPMNDESSMTLNIYPPIQQLESDDTSATSGFIKFGSGSIQDIQVILKKYHLSVANQQFKVSKEITTLLIPKLEELRKDLRVKIQEIKDIHGDFKSNISHHVKLTNQLLNKYNNSIRIMNHQSHSHHEFQPKHDPYLLKLQLDLQLKRQLSEENYLKDAYVNLQSSGMQLEKIIYSKIQNVLQRYTTLIDTEVRLMIKNLCHELQQGILSRPPAFEWDHFVSHHPKCLLNWKSVDPVPQPRKVSEIVYSNMKSPLAKCIRAGYFLKNGSKGYFVLTSNYLHEFKTSNFFNQQSSTLQAPASDPMGKKISTLNGLTPINSISLNECKLIETGENHFTIEGTVFHGPVTTTANQLSPSTSKTSASMSLNATHHKKYHLPNLLKSKKDAKPKTKVPTATTSSGSTVANNKTSIESKVKWTFKPASKLTSEEDSKHFKKWVQDLKS